MSVHSCRVLVLKLKLSKVKLGDYQADDTHGQANDRVRRMRNIAGGRSLVYSFRINKRHFVVSRELETLHELGARN